jgi:hypothetical protein
MPHLIAQTDSGSSLDRGLTIKCKNNGGVFVLFFRKRIRNKLADATQLYLKNTDFHLNSHTHTLHIYIALIHYLIEALEILSQTLTENN